MYDSRTVDRALKGQANIHRHMHKKGCTLAGQPLWTDDEKALVKAHYPDIAKLVVLLIRRTSGAIKRQARQLGLVKPRTRWSAAETSKMPPPYRDGLPVAEIVEVLDDKTKRQVYSKAHHMRVRRPKPPPKATGLQIVDLILLRSHEMGYTRADLNEWTGRSRYWISPRRYDWVAISRAIKVLGGQIVPLWPQ